MLIIQSSHNVYSCLLTYSTSLRPNHFDLGDLKENKEQAKLNTLKKSGWLRRLKILSMAQNTLPTPVSHGTTMYNNEAVWLGQGRLLHITAGLILGQTHATTMLLPVYVFLFIPIQHSLILVLMDTIIGTSLAIHS